MTGRLMTGDSGKSCPESPDGRHHLEVTGVRAAFIVRMARLAAEEPEEFQNGDDLVTRTLQYAGTARPRVTREEVEKALGGISMDHGECVPASGFTARGHIHEGETGWWLWPDDLNPDGTPKGLYDDSPTGA